MDEQKKLAKRRRATSPQPVWSTADEAYLEQISVKPFPENVYSPSRLRKDARIFNEHILNELKAKGRIDDVDALFHGKKMINRMVVNYLRFNEMCSGFMGGGYQTVLDEATNVAGFSRAYDAINVKILDYIAERYPHLREACEEQRHGGPYIDPEDLFRPFLRDE